MPAPVESEIVMRNVPSSLCAFAKQGMISIATTKARCVTQTRPDFSRLAATLVTADRKPLILRVLSQFILVPSIRRNHLNVLNEQPLRPVALCAESLEANRFQ